MLASRGLITPPTKLPTFFFGIRVSKVRIDPKHAIALILRHFHPIAQLTEQVPFPCPVGFLQAIVDCGGTVCQTSHTQRQLRGHGHLIRAVLALLLQPGEPLAQAGHPGRTLVLVQEAIRLTVDQPGHALAPRADLAFARDQRRAVGGGLRRPAAPLFRREPLRGRQPGPHGLPDRQGPQSGPSLRLLTDPLAAKAVRVCAQAAVRGVRARLACPRPRPEALPLAGLATVVAWEPALPPRQGAPARLAGRALMLLQRFLDRRASLGLSERRDRDRAPVLRRDSARGHGTARRHRTVTLGAPPGPPGLLTRLAKRRGPLRGRLLHHAPPPTPIPHGLARAGHLARLGQPAPDLPTRQAVASDPVQDLADHAGFVRDERRAGRPAPRVRGHSMVPIGGAAAHVHRTDAGRLALATPRTLDARGPLVLGTHPLPLQPPVVFRALPPGPGAAPDLDARASARIDQPHLIRLWAGQASRRVPREPVDTVRRNHIAQPLQRRAPQGGPARPFGKPWPRLGHRPPLGGPPLPPGCHLTRNGRGLRVLLRRHARVERSLGGVQAGCLPPTCCSGGALSVWGGEPARGAGRRVMGTTRSYACATQAGPTRLGSNVRRPSRGVLLGRTRRATLASWLPWRGAVARSHALEWSPQTPLTIPGAQLCPWNARRVLSQKVGNFVGSVISPILANIY